MNQATNAYGNSMLYQYTNNSLNAATSAAAQQQTTAGAMASAAAHERPGCGGAMHWQQ